MHRLPATVFKTLALTLIFLFLLDTTLVAVQIMDAHSDISNLSITVKKEIVKNNSLPNVISDLFERQLNELTENSTVVTDIRTNFRSNLTVEGTTYDSLSETNAKQYGEMADLMIQVDFEPTRVYFRTGKNVSSEQKQQGLLARGTFSYSIEYDDTVPCLRYLK